MWLDYNYVLKALQNVFWVKWRSTCLKGQQLQQWYGHFSLFHGEDREEAQAHFNSVLRDSLIHLFPGTTCLLSCPQSCFDSCSKHLKADDALFYADFAGYSGKKNITKAVQLSHCPHSQSPCSENSCHCSMLLFVVQSHFFLKRRDKKLKWLCPVRTRDCLLVYVPSIFVCWMRVLCLHRKKRSLLLLIFLPLMF